MPTHKTRVIETLFLSRWNDAEQTLDEAVVTLEDIGNAIRGYNADLPAGKSGLSDKNPANFFKDFIRVGDRANANWPESVLAKGYTARQKTGSGNCFVFLPLKHDQNLAFPPVCPPPTKETHRHQVQSASLPPLSRRLGRTDEPWLLQVLIRLRVLETHLVLESPRNVIYVDHLQMNVKLRDAEVDALFLATEQLEDDKTRELILTFEAKRTDDILEDQIVSQVEAVFGAQKEHDTVIPMAAKTIGSDIYIVEFQAMSRIDFDDSAAMPQLKVVSAALYTLVPSVPGI